MPLISLIGYRGTGKSTIAQLLAERLDWPWIDADVELETRAGSSIKEIFRKSGESEFRDWESSIVESLTREDRANEGMVVAWGGGVILREKNRDAICKEKARGGKIIWLTADAETILQRISGDPTSGERRPNLTIGGGLEEIKKLLANRAPLYRDCADFIVDTVGNSPAKIADDIDHWLKSH